MLCRCLAVSEVCAPVWGNVVPCCSTIIQLPSRTDHFSQPQGGATVDALNSLAPWFGKAISVQGGMFCADNLTTGYTPLQVRRV